MAYYGLTVKSGNQKTGPIATMKTSKDTCPAACPLKEAACYGEGFRLKKHWEALPEKGMDIEGFCQAVGKIPPGKLIRLFEVGDIPPGKKERERLFKGVSHLKAFGYTHRSPTESLVSFLKSQEATMNLSANNLTHLDAIAGKGIPCVTVLPWDHEGKVTYTEKGLRVVTCPATYKEGFTCAQCGGGDPLCARKDRDYAIGFPGHGNRKKQIN